MRFYYFLLDTDEPAVRINLARPQYGIAEAIHDAGFDYVPNSLYIGRTHFHFLSEKELEPNDLLSFNQRLLENEELSALCARFGSNRSDGMYFHLQGVLQCGALLDDFDIMGSAVAAQLQFFDLRDVAPLFEDFCFYDEIEEGPFRRAFYAYHQFGLESREFQLAKLDYLVTMRLIDGLCLFPDRSWHFYQVGRYYRIDVAVDNPQLFNRALWSGFSLYSPNVDPNGIYPCRSITISDGSCCLHQEPLSALYETLFAAVEFPRSKAAPVALHSFDPTSTFSEAIVFDVGQALMVALVDQNDLRGFFDFGLPNAFNKRYLPNYNLIAAATAALIRNSTRLSTIIISHTHTDHINMAFQVPDSYLLDWHVPSNSSPSWTRISALIQQAGGSVTVYTPYSAMPNWGNISIQKINTPTSYHPHANGIFAELNLSSGNRVLLPGDCILSRVAAAVGPNYTYTYLQASHHGGVYFLPSDESNPGGIPAPNPVMSCICYSYSQPNTHHHPSYDANYWQMGWTNAQLTPQAPLALTGHAPPINTLKGFTWT
jgi:hypothetical protein